MALVAYSDSDSDDDEPLAKRLKKEDSDDAPPPLPASFHNLYSSSVRVSNTDDPSLHAGRKRVVKHVEGNWPAHVYLEWVPSPSEHDTLSHLLAALPDATAVQSLLQTPLGVPLPLHISLSAPLVLRTNTKDAFLDALTDQLTPLIRSLRRPAIVRPAGLSWHGNEDSSRYFLVLRLEDAPGEEGALVLLNQLLRASNRVAQRFGQPPLYTGRSRRTAAKEQTERQSQHDDKRDFSPYFHISIAWALPSPDLNPQDENLKMQPAVATAMKDAYNMTVPLDAVKIRIGQTVTALPFGSKSQSKCSILG